MLRALVGVLASVYLATIAAACGSTPPMPKGPPPEYEEHDAGTPVFEGDSPNPASPNPASSAAPRSPAPEKR